MNITIEMYHIPNVLNNCFGKDSWLKDYGVL